ncbi:SgcJ/EcaC family oxidoreductase [Spirillospora sp. NBC_00431]
MPTPVTRLAIIVGSTRPHRRADSVVAWVRAAQPPDCELTVVDLAEADLPMLSEPAPAMFGRYTQESTRRWSELIAGFDGYVLVTPEYNHSTSAVLKNALDHLYAEWGGKPVAFVGYGVQGGTRAVEHLRSITAALGMAGVGPHVTLDIFQDFDGDACAPRPDRARERDRMLDDLTRWTTALRPLRVPRPGTGDGDRPALHDPAASAGARAAVEMLVAELNAAAEALDADRYDGMFAADVLWGSPYGRTLAGYDTLNAVHRRLMAKPVVPASRYEIVQTLAPAQGVAVAHVRRRPVADDGKGHPLPAEMAMYVLVEREGHWWLAGGQNTPIAEAS